MSSDQDDKNQGPEPSQPFDINPMQHPDEQPAGGNGSPRFGRLLIILAIAVLFVVFVTFASEAYFSRGLPH